MGTVNVAGLVQVLSSFGPVGLIALIWYIDMRAMRKMHSDHRQEIFKILANYKEDVAEIRRMYENNVKLVDDYEIVAKDLKDIVVLNTQCLTQLSDEIRQNQFCPIIRVEKKKVAVEAGG